MGTWKIIHLQPPPKEVALKTKIVDEAGERNEQYLILRGHLWWTADRKMYVYYTPTHWYSE